MRLGKKPARFDKRTLQFADYVHPKLLPAVPPVVDHQSKISAWPMFGNDRRGDCVLASAAHQIQEWTTYAGDPHMPTDSQVVALYDRMSPSDDGLDILSTLNIWWHEGLWSDKIDAFVQLRTGDIEQAKAAIYLFGAIKIGMSLPDVNVFGPWIDVTGPPEPYNGHDVPLVGYNAEGPIAISWGEEMQMSWAWYQKYCDEAYAILSKDWLNEKGLDPDGFDYPSLYQDLQDLTGVVPPPPPPLPSPSPGCLPVLIGAVLGILLWVGVLHGQTDTLQLRSKGILPLLPNATVVLQGPGVEYTFHDSANVVIVSRDSRRVGVVQETCPGTLRVDQCADPTDPAILTSGDLKVIFMARRRLTHGVASFLGIVYAPVTVKQP